MLSPAALVFITRSLQAPVVTSNIRHTRLTGQRIIRLLVKLLTASTAIMRGVDFVVNLYSERLGTTTTASSGPKYMLRLHLMECVCAETISFSHWGSLSVLRQHAVS
jgi:hypothetical protein